MNAVGADDGIRDRRCAIGKSEANAVPGLIQTDELVAQLDALVGNGARQRGVQIATMRQQIRRAEFLFGGFAENHVEFDFAGSPIPVVPGARVKRLLAQS